MFADYARLCMPNCSYCQPKWQGRHSAANPGIHCTQAAYRKVVLLALSSEVGEQRVPAGASLHSSSAHVTQPAAREMQGTVPCSLCGLPAHRVLMDLPQPGSILFILHGVLAVFTA
jgi:hypothetical protein